MTSFKHFVFVSVYVLVSVYNVNCKCPTSSETVNLGPHLTDIEVRIILNLKKADITDVYEEAGIDLIHSDGIAIEANMRLFTVDKVCLDIENGDSVEFIFFPEEEVALSQTVKAMQTNVCLTDIPSGSFRGLQIKFRNTEDIMQTIHVKKFTARICLEK